MDKRRLVITASGLVLVTEMIISGNADDPQQFASAKPPVGIVNIAPSGVTSEGFNWAHDLPEGVSLRFERGYDPVKGPVTPLRVIQGGRDTTNFVPSIPANPDPAGHPWYGGSDDPDG